MTSEQAIQVLTNATSVLQATRQQHQEIALALQTLQAAVQPKPIQPKPEKIEVAPEKKLKGV